MPSFLPIIPSVISSPVEISLQLDIDFHARGQIQLGQGIDGLRGRFDDIDEAFMGAHLELFLRVLIDKRRPYDAEFLDARRQRYRPHGHGAGAFHRFLLLFLQSLLLALPVVARSC
jgi:hypothetical protein